MQKKGDAEAKIRKMIDDYQARAVEKVCSETLAPISGDRGDGGTGGSEPRPLELRAAAILRRSVLNNMSAL